MNIGIIGAGKISESHVAAYLKNASARVLAVADLNYSAAKELADKYGIDAVYSDYREILRDPSIDAVSVATPTFTHTEIVKAALKSGKHVLCEKPPALSADEVRECFLVAEEANRVLMYGLVCRFRKEIEYLKDYIASGKMGRIITAEAERTSRVSRYYGWFNSRALGGGIMRDGAIHELDQLLYLMSYPEPETLFAVADGSSGALLEEISDVGAYESRDRTQHERDVEDVVKLLITFKDGASLSIKTSSILMTLEPSYYMELSGSRGGARVQPFGERKLRLLEIEDGALTERDVAVEPTSLFSSEIDHFIECASGRAECICRKNEIITLMRIIDAIYLSAETKKAVYF